MLAAGYETELQSLLDRSSAQLDDLKHASTTDGQQDMRTQRAAYQQLEVQLQQAESLLRRIDMGTSDDNAAESLSNKRQCLKKLRKSFEKAKSTFEREEIFNSRGSNGGSGGAVGPSQAERQRFEQVTARMESSNDALMETRRALADTEDVAMDITQELGRNRETLLSAHGKLKTTGGVIVQAGRILRNLQKREARRKVIMGGLIVLMIFVIGLIIYAANAKPSSSSSTPSPVPSADP